MNVGGHFSKSWKKDSGYFPYLSSSTRNLRPFLQKSRIPDSKASRDPLLRANLVEDPSPNAKISEAYNHQVHTGLLQSGAGLVEKAKTKTIEAKDAIEEFETFEENKIELKSLEVSAEKSEEIESKKFEEKGAQKRSLEIEDSQTPSANSDSPPEKKIKHNIADWYWVK